MTLSTKDEKALVSQDELATLAQTHFPALYLVDDSDLASLHRRVRDLRDKERTLARGMTRSIRGKAESRGSSFPGNVEKPARRKQVFAGALKRLAKESSRRKSVAARESLREAAHRALALRTANTGGPNHPGSRTSRGGMAPKVNTNRRTAVNRAKIGSVSQATKNAQARKDDR